jgi:hypothetical protein
VRKKRPFSRFILTAAIVILVWAVGLSGIWDSGHQVYDGYPEEHSPSNEIPPMQPTCTSSGETKSNVECIDGAPVIDGLVFTISMVKSGYRVGENMTLTTRLRNVGDCDRIFSGTEWNRSGNPWEESVNGIRLILSLPNGSVINDWWWLSPGYPLLWFGLRPNKEINQTTYLHLQTSFVNYKGNEERDFSEPGEYFVRCIYNSNPRYCYVYPDDYWGGLTNHSLSWDHPPPWNDFWIGQLASNLVSFRIG